jgi:NADH-quinone oxidoreductase subunit H
VGLIIFTLAGLAETRRMPFDLPESENELVAGFHTEYSGMKFGMFFVGEYMGVILISSLITVLYFGGWLGPFAPGLHWFLLKTFFFICMFILCRAGFSPAALGPTHDVRVEIIAARFLGECAHNRRGYAH